MHGVDLSRRSALIGLAATAFAPNAAAQQPALWREIQISAKQINRFSKTSTETRFGRLTFRGGLALTSPDPEFGGISGLVIEPDGRSFLAITDEGAWLAGRFTSEGTTPIGIESARIGSIPNAGGVTATRKRDKDCEALALLEGTLANGTLLIAFERNHRIERFPVRDAIVQPSAGILTMPQTAGRMEANKGLEAMTVLAGGPYAGSVIAFSERLLDAEGRHTGWLWIDGTPKQIGLTAVSGFDLTDAAALPDGALLVLERRFRWTEGVKMQLRLVPAAQIAPGRIAEGQVLLTADNDFDIDNMESLAVHQELDGTTVLTIMSDDNFNRLVQRTVLLRFAFNA